MVSVKIESSDTLMEKIISIVSNQLCLEPSKVNPKANFSIDLGADSLDLVELVMALEEGFGIEIPDAKASDISTVEEAYNFIQTQMEVA